MKPAINRRQFISRSAMAAAGLGLAGCSTRKISPNEKLNIAVIGTAHRAGDDLEFVSGENIVALCDVDADYLAAAQAKFPRAAAYGDFRRMLEQRDIDAVVVATPDHTHAVAAVAALQSGRHVYCEKPLARTVSEARRIAEAARRHRRVTQMGTQIHATANYHRVVDLIRGGVIGPVREVHVWVPTVYTASGLPAEKPPVPAPLDWDLWLGPADMCAYSPLYVPKKWRCWWAFGGGTLSDLGCHYMDLPYWALNLKYPTSVEAEGPPVNPYGTPAWMTVHYDFPARGESPPVRMTWYHGVRDGAQVLPPLVTRGDAPKLEKGILFIGDKGMLLAQYWKYLLLPEKKFSDQPAEPDRKDDPYEQKHHQEWINAIKKGGTTSCNFDYSGALSEAVLLGNVAYRVGAKIQWDPVGLAAMGNPAADEYIHHKYRRGWKI